MPLLITLSTLQAVLIAASVLLLCLVLALALRRTQREREEFHHLLVANYDRCVRGLHGVLSDRRRLCEQVSNALTDLPPESQVRAELVGRRLAEGLRVIKESLVTQLHGETRLELDFETFHSELTACDETLAEVADLLVKSVMQEEQERLRQSLEDLRSESESVKSKLTRRVEELEEEKTGLEKQMETMTDSEELEETRHLLEAMERSIDELEESLVDSEGKLVKDIGEDDLNQMETMISEIDKSIQGADEEIHESSDSVMAHGRGQKLRLQRIRRGVLDRCVRHRRIEQRATELEGQVKALESVGRDNEAMMLEFQKIESSSAQFRQVVGESRQQLQLMSERIREFETMEETSQRVRTELRNLGIINLDLQRQVEELEHSQALYQRVLRNLSKLNAEIEERDQRIGQMEKTIKLNEREIERLQSEIERLRTGEGVGQLPAEATIDDEELKAVLATGDLDTMRDTLRSKIQESETMRRQIESAEAEAQEKTKRIASLEDELDNLAQEYQRLFQEMPFRE